MTTTRTARPKPVTAEELLEMNSRGIKGELIQGVLSQVMSAGGQHGEIAMILGAAMLAVVRPNRLGRVTGTDASVLLDRDNNVVREPDIAFFSSGKLPPGEVVAGYYEIVPDLVVEIASPGDTNAEVNDKCRMWIATGCLWYGSCILNGVRYLCTGSASPLLSYKRTTHWTAETFCRDSPFR